MVDTLRRRCNLCNACLYRLALPSIVDLKHWDEWGLSSRDRRVLLGYIPPNGALGVEFSARTLRHGAIGVSGGGGEGGVLASSVGDGHQSELMRLPAISAIWRQRLCRRPRSLLCSLFNVFFLWVCESQSSTSTKNFRIIARPTPVLFADLSTLSPRFAGIGGRTNTACPAVFLVRLRGSRIPRAPYDTFVSPDVG